ncbi:MAG TPA: hypothetical protein VLJ11_10870 [Bryobacteraceae bacterium]|nr:hypothetical protein [Bryobacteraceae bacterium]
MKLSIFATATLLGLSLVPLAHAQVTSPIRGNIPFDFQVGDTVLPAGTYVVSRLSITNPQGVLTLRGVDQKKGRTIMFSTGVMQGNSGQNTKLVFHRYGSTYFLSQVLGGFGQNGNVLYPSKAERVTARQMAALAKPRNVELASVSFSPVGE